MTFFSGRWVTSKHTEHTPEERVATHWWLVTLQKREYDSEDAACVELVALHVNLGQVELQPTHVKKTLILIKCSNLISAEILWYI